MKTEIWQIGLVVAVMVLAGVVAPAFGEIYADLVVYPYGPTDVVNIGKTLDITYPILYTPATQARFPDGCHAGDLTYPQSQSDYDIKLFFIGRPSAIWVDCCDDDGTVLQSNPFNGVSYAWDGVVNGYVYYVDLSQHSGLSWISGFTIKGASDGSTELDAVRADNYVCSNMPPVPDAGGPYVEFATTWDGATVVLDASASSDPDGDGLAFAWDFDGDGVVDSDSVTCEWFFPVGITGVSLTVTDGKGASTTLTTDVTVSYWEVVIDVKPGSDDNVINMGSNGVIPVAFLTDATFDATAIDPLTVTLRGEDFSTGLVRMRGKKDSVPQATSTDVDGDGDVDLLVHIETDKLADYNIETTIELGAKTLTGEVILGRDTLTVIHQE